eukprot:Skav202142  [mRNA]  locus=scaffold970:8036:8530:+ [translate_table: standard]
MLRLFSCMAILNDLSRPGLKDNVELQQQTQRGMAWEQSMDLGTALNKSHFLRPGMGAIQMGGENWTGKPQMSLRVSGIEEWRILKTHVFLKMKKEKVVVLEVLDRMPPQSVVHEVRRPQSHGGSQSGRSALQRSAGNWSLSRPGWVRSQHRFCSVLGPCVAQGA